MADPSTSVIQLAGWLAKAIADSASLFADFTSEPLGVELPAPVFQTPQVVSALQDAQTSALKVGTLGEKLATEAAAGDEVKILAAFVELGVALAEFYAALGTLMTEVRANVTAITVPDPAARTIAENFAEDLAKILSETIFGSFLTDRAPRVGFALRLLGLLEWELVPENPTNPLSRDHVRRLLKLNRIKGLISDPVQHYKDVFGWGRAEFDPASLFHLYRSFWSKEFDVEIGDSGGDPFLRQGNFRLARDRTTNPPSLALSFEAGLKEELEARHDIDDDWGAGVSSSLLMIGSINGRVSPPFTLSLTSPSGSITGELRTFFNRNSEARPLDILSGIGILSLSATDLKVGIGAKASWDGTTATIQPVLFAELAGATLRLDTSNSDGFVAKLLGNVDIEGEFDLSLEWTPDHGLRVKASGGVEIAVPIHKQLGPIALETLYFLLKILSDGTLSFEISTAITGKLGPLSVAVERIGALLDLRFVEGTGGDFGPFDLNLGFKPPQGVGLSLDAGGFKGGGFLMFDSEKGEYAGALELDFNGLFSVKAIGIINTKMPDGKKGFSLLIVIAAEFTPIQLSFGFTLNGVGGIFGLNRRIVVAALAEGIRTNAVKSILFPENVIANISRIISDIKQFFPPQKDHFVVGPMAKLGWGTPSIITVELGLLLDLPDPMFAIVGVLKAVLPAEEAPILRLQVNFLGVIDFGRGYIFFRADLFDSRLLVYSITGSMAFLVSWGEAKALALSVGGFHPDFRDIPSIPALPDGFRSMARIGISLLSDDNPRLKIESYFAVTSNTVQFGARIELYAEAGGFNIYGFLGYDVLFQFDPFRFVAKLSGGVALRRHSSVIAGVNISATLSGPTPWDARGKATLSFLFFSISVGFHATWGDPPPAIAPATEDLLKLLQREFADTRNWRADLPPNNHLHVSIRKIELPAAAEMLVIHPAGVLTFSQRSLPLEDFVIQKFGTRKPLAENKFKITHANSDNAEIPADYQSVREQFAPGNFLELSDSEKLSRKSFDNLPSGFKLTATADLLTTLPVVRPVDYELSYLRRARIVRKGLIQIFVLAYERLVKGSAVRQSGLAQQQTRISLNAPPQVGLPQETFAVANAADLKSHVTNASGPVFFATQAEAYQQQQELIAQNPALAGQIQVVSHFELNPN